MSPEHLLAAMSPAGHELLVRIGRRFGARAVLHQARHTLAALEQHGPALVPFGFGEAQAQLLAEAFAAAQTLAKQAEQEPAQTPKSTDAAYLLGLDQAKRARSRARSVLLSTYRHLRMVADAAQTAALAPMREVLAATSGPGGDDRIYAAELAQLLEMLDMPAVAAAVAPESARSEAHSLLEAALAELGSLEATAPHRNEPGLSQRDAIDGMIVELARTAHFAAKVAASELGERGLGKAFRLRFMS